MGNKYDLRGRTYAFAVRIVKFCVVLNKNPEIKILVNQLLRAGTSIGANVEEADGSRTRKEFANKMTIARNEAKETLYWLKSLIDSGCLLHDDNIIEARNLAAECDELSRIISAIIGKLQ
ncbi:MAG: four helix bundle protein [Candidatus Saganbacteria bacterium]|nr:four helix bundle protein [Candidatus Saganbacteria bacterium]